MPSGLSPRLKLIDDRRREGKPKRGKGGSRIGLLSTFAVYNIDDC